MRHQHKPLGKNCGPHPANQVIHPTKQCVVHNCIEHDVTQVHPTHTTTVNHHLIKNHHVYPQTNSVENTVESMNVNGGPGNQVAGAMSPPPYGNNGLNNNSGPNNNVAGAHMPSNGAMGPCCNKPKPGHHDPMGMNSPHHWR